MWPFNRKKADPKDIRPLFSVAANGPPPARMLEIARQISMGTGLMMLCADAANQTMRHCRIGMVYPKREGEQ